MVKSDNPVTPPSGIARERRRVDQLLRRDAKERQREDRRRDAISVAASGGVPDNEAMTVPPTREWKNHGEYGTVTVREGQNPNDPPVRTVRRITAQRIFKLHQSGVIDDDRYKACHIYRTTYEGSGYDGRCTTTRFNPTGVTSPSGYDLLPRTEAEAIKRDLFRRMQSWIEPRMVNIFDLVVLGDRTLKQAGIEGRCSDRTAKTIVRLGSLQIVNGLHDLNIWTESNCPTPDFA